VNISVTKHVYLVSIILDKLAGFSDTHIIRFAKTGKYDGVICTEPIPPVPVGYLNQLFTLDVLRPENKINIPVYAMHFQDSVDVWAATLFRSNLNSPVIVKISPFDVNVWTEAYRTLGFRLFQFILFALAAFNAYTAIKKEILFSVRRSFELNVVQIILMVHAISSLIRTTNFVVDPLLHAQIFPFEVGTYFQTITFPLEVICSLLFAFYWFGLIDQSNLNVSSFLGKFSIPFIILGVIILAQEIVGGALRIVAIASQVLITIVTLNAIFYLVIYIPVQIFFFVIGFIVLNKTKQLRDNTSKKLRKVTIRILFSGVLLLIWLIPICFTITNTLFASPADHITIWFFLNFLLLLSAAIQLSAIKTPKKGSNTTKNSSTGGKGKGNQGKGKGNQGKGKGNQGKGNQGKGKDDKGKDDKGKDN